MLIQLNPTIPMIVTNKDNAKGYALAVIDYSQEHDLFWVIALDNGEIWTVDNKYVRIQDNWSLGREANNNREMNEFLEAAAEQYKRPSEEFNSKVSDELNRRSGHLQPSQVRDVNLGGKPIW